MKALVIEHEPDGVAGHVGDRLIERGFELHSIAVTNDDGAVTTTDFGPPDPFDLIVPMGSIQSVYDTATIGQWIDAELTLLRHAHQSGIPVLGVCFGGQALAAALGGSVEPSPNPEVGWTDIQTDVDELRGPWMEWHYDRFSPPPSATVLATTDRNPQAFTLGRSLGLQFHPEVDADMVDHWLGQCPAEYLERHGIDPDTIRAESAHWATDARKRCHRLVDWFLDEIATQPIGAL